MKKLSREEMKNVMGGKMAPACTGSCDYQWTDANGKTQTTSGYCKATAGNPCYCSNGAGSGCSGNG